MHYWLNKRLQVSQNLCDSLIIFDLIIWSLSAFYLHCTLKIICWSRGKVREVLFVVVLECCQLLSRALSQEKCARALSPHISRALSPRLYTPNFNLKFRIRLFVSTSVYNLCCLFVFVGLLIILLSCCRLDIVGKSARLITSLFLVYWFLSRFAVLFVCILLTCFRYSGHCEKLARWGPLQFTQVGGVSVVLVQSLVVCWLSHLTHLALFWQ